MKEISWSVYDYECCFHATIDPLSFTFFLTYLLPYLSFPLRIDPLRLQAGCRKRRLNLALVFLCLFSSFLLIGECTLLLCYVWFFRTKPRDWLGETSPKWLVLCRVARITTAQLINPGLNRCLPSVVWRCWLGGRKGIRPVKNWVVGCWHGYLSGARCRLAYGPIDATDTHCLLLQ